MHAMDLLSAPRARLRPARPPWGSRKLGAARRFLESAARSGPRHRPVTLLGIAALLLAGCGVPLTEAALTAPPRSEAPAGGAVELGAPRSVNGGVLAGPGAAFGMPQQPGSGAFVRLVAPTAIALRGNDLLIVDPGTARVWRADLGFNTLSVVAGVPAVSSTAVALGPDLAAWVLDGVARQVQRVGRDGRPLQTFRATQDSPAPTAFALADAGATLLLADAGLRQWLEVRGVGGVAPVVVPRTDAGETPRGVDAIAQSGDLVYLLDRAAALVHVVRRDGRVIGRLGEGQLKAPVALAADRAGHVAVLDAHDNAVKFLREGAPAQVFDAARLRVQVLGGIALDDAALAVSDRVAGQVWIHPLRAGARP